jgi:hypothetical protein
MDLVVRPGVHDDGGDDAMYPGCGGGGVLAGLDRSVEYSLVVR